MKKRKTRRNKTLYPGLNKTYNLPIRHDLIDQDYLDKLSPEEKKWLSNFNEEYVSANLNHSGKILHRTKKLRKSIYDSNNARNRDSYSVTKTNGMLDNEKSFPVDSKKNNIEDVLIELIDAKDKINNDK